MPTGGPTLISCSATVAESLIVQAVTMSDSRVFINKDHRGNPWRELEMFTLAEVRNPTGPLFFNLDPVRVEILDQSFQLITGVNTSGDIVRFYYNSGTSTELRRIDLDVVANVASAPVILPFAGRDPYIVDARTGGQPSRFYLVYLATDGRNVFRQSFDLGVTWGAETTIDDATALTHAQCEANLNDPLGAKESVQVLQRRNA